MATEEMGRNFTWTNTTCFRYKGLRSISVGCRPLLHVPSPVLVPIRFPNSTKRALEALHPVPPSLRWEAHRGSPVSTLCALDKTPLVVTASTDSTIRLFSLADIQVISMVENVLLCESLVQNSTDFFAVGKIQSYRGNASRKRLATLSNSANALSASKPNHGTEEAHHSGKCLLLFACPLAPCCNIRWELSRSKPPAPWEKLICATRKVCVSIAPRCERGCERIVGRNRRISAIARASETRPCVGLVAGRVSPQASSTATSGC